MNRTVMSLALALCGATAATAEPILWGYRVVDATTGELRAERSGIADPWLTFQAVTPPEASFANPEAVNESRVTITDERTGSQHELGVSWVVKQQWDRRIGDDGLPYWDWTSEYSEPTRIFPGYGWRPDGGRHHYTILSEGGGVSVNVEALSTVTTPEPGTLILCGVAAVGGFGAWWRKRK
jgi:hypothetical protein